MQEQVFYLKAKKFVYEKGYKREIEWQKNIINRDFDESTFLKQTAWVILCSGFREKIIRNKFDRISLCFCDWESAQSILNSKKNVKITALKIFDNKKKIEAILDATRKISNEGFSSLKDRIKNDPIEVLKEFSYIGTITAYHLAKNLGVNIAKPDRHLVKVAERLGYNDVQTLCTKISKSSNDPIAVVDLVIWRYCVLNPGYLNLYPLCS